MPKAYVIFRTRVHDAERHARYLRRALDSVRGHGGRVLVAHDGAERIEGAWPEGRTAVFEFDTLFDARRWYASSDYQSAAVERRACAEAEVALFAGFEPVPC